MNTYDLSKVKKLLIYGMIGAVLNMIGDCLLLGVDSVGAVGAFGQYILAAQKVSYTRIGLAGFFGYVGIPVSIFGYYVLYEIMEDKTSLLARLYRASLYAFVAFGGAIHIICCYLLTGMKKALETGTAPDDNILTVILQEQGGYIVPCFVVFFLFYFINVVTMALIIAKKKTCLPGWMWIINPLLFKIIFNGLGKMSTSAVLNGIACSNMSLGALVIFTVWMVVLCQKSSKAA